MRINKLLGAVVLSLAITDVPAAAVAAERTEGDKFANNYGFGTPSETVAAVERTEGDKFANNYGYGTPSDLLVDRGQRADAARWQAQADAYLAGRVADVSTAVERTEGDKFANNYGFGADDDMVVNRGQRADAARWQAQADAHLAGQLADVSTPSAPADPGLPW